MVGEVLFLAVVNLTSRDWQDVAQLQQRFKARKDTSFDLTKAVFMCSTTTTYFYCLNAPSHRVVDVG